MKTAIFWAPWSVLLTVNVPAWVYGELGTIMGGYPHAPLVWFISFLLAIGLGVTGAMKSIGDI